MQKKTLTTHNKWVGYILKSKKVTSRFNPVNYSYIITYYIHF
jgi:hypothetical protein